MPTREYLRVSLEDANAGKAAGWTFAAGWFAFGLTWWAWFVREVSDG